METVNRNPDNGYGLRMDGYPFTRFFRYAWSCETCGIKRSCERCKFLYSILNFERQTMFHCPCGSGIRFNACGYCGNGTTEICVACKRRSTRKGVCYQCKTGNKSNAKAKQLDVQEHIKERFGYLNTTINTFIRFDRHYLDCVSYYKRFGPEKASKYRPDVHIRLDTWDLIVEIDEKKHKGYKERDWRRLYKIREDLGRPISCIRLYVDMKDWEHCKNHYIGILLVTMDRVIRGSCPDPLLPIPMKCLFFPAGWWS